MKKNLHLMLSILLCIILQSVPQARADRPLDTESADTNGKGVVSLEVGNDWTTGWDGETATSQGYVITYGLTDNLDLCLEKPAGFLGKGYAPGGHYSGDTVLLLKYRFLDQKGPWPAVGIAPYVDCRDGSALGTTEKTEVGINLFATRYINDLKIHANVGLCAPELHRGLGRDDEYNYSLAVEKGLGKNFTLAAEIVGCSTTNTTGPLYGLAGISWALSESFSFDAGYARGFNRYAPKHRFTIGTTITF